MLSNDLRGLVETGQCGCDQRRRHAVLLGKDNVETDDSSAQLVRWFKHFSDGRSGPAPMPDFREALFVDIDNADSIFADRARR